MLTVLFKLLRGRTKVLTAPHKGGVSRRLPRAFLRDDFLLRIVAHAAKGDENFSLEGQDAVTRLQGIPGGISRIIYRSGAARGNDDDRRDEADARRLFTSRINGLANRARKSKATLDMIRTAHRAGIFFSCRKSRGETFNWTIFYIKGTKRDIAVSRVGDVSEIFSYVLFSLSLFK